MKWLKNLFNRDNGQPDPRTQYTRWANVIEHGGLYTVEVATRRTPVFRSHEEVSAYADAKGIPPDAVDGVEETKAGVYLVERCDLSRVKPQPSRERLLAYLAGLNYKRLARAFQDSDVVFGDWVSNPDPPPPPRPPMGGWWPS